MRNKTINLSYIIPVLLSFFVMSFVDLVGTGVDEYKQDADVPNYILQLIPFVAFIWFFLLSIPVGIWQDRIGKKRMLNIGILITVIALFIPMIGYSLPIILLTFALIGIGNTILQVAANPLLVDVIPSEKTSSFLSLSQFIKSIGSMIGPFVAAAVGPWLASLVGDNSPGQWRYGLYLFGVISFLSWLWLSRVTIDEHQGEEKRQRASFSSCIKLLSNPFILMLVMGIFVVVGLDVAMNSTIGTFLEGKHGIDAETAKYGKTIYFFAKMIGTLVGAVLLLKLRAKPFLTGSAILATIALFAIANTSSEIVVWLTIGIISLGLSNIFPLIFSIAAKRMPDRTNEISALMMMAICGGAILPFITGICLDYNLEGGIYFLLVLSAYLVFIGLRTNTES